MRTAPTGAWDLWRDEVRMGARSALDYDELFVAAWMDAGGLDALEDGLPELAAMWFTESEYHVLRMGVARV